MRDLRRWLGGCAGGVTVAAACVMGQACSRTPSASPAALATPTPVDPPASRPRLVDTEFASFQAEVAAVRDAPTRDAAALVRLMRHVDAYEPNPPPDKWEARASRNGLYATSSLANVARSWTLHGPLPELRERALANAVRLSVDEAKAMQTTCAAMLLAVRESDGAASMTTEQAGTLDRLLGDPTVRGHLDRMLESWATGE